MINNQFVYKNSIWQDLFNFLVSKGYDVNSPGVKVGECISEYLVIKNNGSSKHQSFSTDVDRYVIMCYVPKQHYSDLEPLVQRVKHDMKELMPLLRPAGNQTPSYYDDAVKAHTISIEYINYKKI